MELIDLKETDVSIACTLTADELAERRGAITRDIINEYQEIRALPDGNAIRFPGDAGTAHTLLDFIVRERACCAFLTFTMHFEPQQGAIWLHIRGREGTQEFIRTMLQT